MQGTHWCSVSSVYIGVVTRGHQLVIPESLQEQVISICHKGHLGIVKTKKLPWSKVWFPGIDKSVERKITSCIPCQASINSSQCEPLKMSPTPEGPWLQVSADFCGPLPTGEMVLHILDPYSKYPEVESVSSIAAKDTIPALERIFAHPNRNLVRHTQAKLMVTNWETTQRLQWQSSPSIHHLYPAAVVDLSRILAGWKTMLRL